MTPQLMQAIKLLQLSNLELTAYVDGEVERNPLLERGTEAERRSGPLSPDGNAASAGGCRLARTTGRCRRCIARRGARLRP